MSSRDVSETPVRSSLDSGWSPGGVDSRFRRNSGAFECRFWRVSRRCRVEMPAKLRCIRVSILAGFPAVSGRDAGETQVPSSLDSGGFPGDVESRCRRNSGAFGPGFWRVSRWCRFEMSAKLRCLRVLILAGLAVMSNRDAGETSVWILAGLAVMSVRDDGETQVPSGLDSSGSRGDVESRCRRNSGAFEGWFWQTSQCRRIEMPRRQSCA